jgi:preprotein translocase subunit SecE
MGISYMERTFNKTHFNLGPNTRISTKIIIIIIVIACIYLFIFQFELSKLGEDNNKRKIGSETAW